MPNAQKNYWDQKIKSWTLISYGRKTARVSPVEKLANLFRGPISGRLTTALDILGPMAKNKVILELGCGLGDFCFAIVKYQPKKVIGVDISPVAVSFARQETEKRKLSGTVDFISADVAGLKKLPGFDYAVGLGFIDYLNKEELKSLFKHIAGKYFLFSVFEKKLSLVNLIHAVYLKYQACPGAYKYSRKELLSLASGHPKAYFLEKNKMLFITNLPQRPKKTE